MSRLLCAAFFVLALALPVFSFSGVAHSQQQPTLESDEPPTTGSVVSNKRQVELAVQGWSAIHDVIGKEIINDASPPQTIGKITDIIIEPGASISYAVVDVGEFVGKKKKYVLIEAKQFSPPIAGKFVLLGITKEMLIAVPQFRYAR
jgi:hypothetical protein